MHDRNLSVNEHFLLNAGIPSIEINVNFETMKKAASILLAFVCLVMISCNGNKNQAEENTFLNPIIQGHNNTSIVHYDSLYYYIYNELGHLKVACSEDVTKLFSGKVKSVFDMSKIGLVDLWHPQLVRIDGVWYIYVTADDGNTDNHRIYALRNTSQDLFDGEFEFVTKIQTDPNDNWAIHPYVFKYKDNLYMLWSGWEQKREYKETQCIYIARMKTPFEIEGERHLISRPEYEWEIQYVQRGGYSYTRYPVLVNEAPFFFCNEDTDKAYIFYSASANWTSFICVGELSADKGSDLLDPSSWKKSPEPVFRQDREKGIYGPAWPYIFYSAKRGKYYLVYSTIGEETSRLKKTIFLQPISIIDGHPVLGEPVSRLEKVLKP